MNNDKIHKVSESIGGLSSSEINTLPLCRYEGAISLINVFGDWKNALSDIEEDGIIGFDTETRPSFRKGKANAPALVQLATEKKVYLIQLSKLPFGSYLTEVLSNPHILKVGVGIRFDMRQLGKIYPFEPAGLVDLGLVAKFNKISAQGLRTLAAHLLGLRISKTARCSNWEQPELSQKQIAYAATDAWIGRRIYLCMRELGFVFPATAPGSDAT